MPDVVHIEYKENSPSYRVHPVYDETTAHIQKMVFEQRDQYEYQNKVNEQIKEKQSYIYSSYTIKIGIQIMVFNQATEFYLIVSLLFLMKMF
jgi:hypothetical protein